MSTLNISNGNISNTTTTGNLLVNNFTISDNINFLNSGLSGKGYTGYFNDNPYFFKTASSLNSLITPDGLYASINNFSSSPNNDSTIETYSWEWVGYFLPPSTGTWTFYTSSDDASYVWLGSNAASGYTNTNALVNNGGLHGYIEASGSITLNKGTYYPIRVQYGEATGGDLMTLSFAGPNVSKTANGSGYFFSGTTANPSQISFGNSIVNSSVVSVPSLVLSGTTITGPIYGAVVNTQIFTANGTWTNPNANTILGLTGNEQVLVMMWGGGGGGSNNNLGSRGGGGGGACVIGSFRVSDCNAVCNVVVGLGGSAGAVSTNGSPGTASIFWPNTTISLSAYGGAGAYGAASVNPAGGGGGGWISNGTIATTGGVGGSPLGGSGPSGNSTFGGGGGANTTLGTNGGISIFGGGGGAGAGSSALGANSIYGGGGGAGSGNNIGVSVFGGNGGANSVLTAIVPGGGGSGTQNGARGEVRIWVIK